MCTAIVYQTRDRYAGRTLDLTASYGESVVVTPRNFPLPFRHLPALRTHRALLGVALVSRGYPLYYDAVNDAGLYMAGLRFPGQAVYRPPEPGADNAASFELIPWVLGRCATAAEARDLLARLRVTDTAFSPALPPAPLHWLLSGRDGTLVLEPGPEGLRVHEDPVGVLANIPPFPSQLDHLAGFRHLTREVPEDRFAPGLALELQSLGLGARGLPGDFSSASRFVRAAFVAGNAVSGPGEAESVSQLFHLLDAVAVPRGCVRGTDGAFEHTLYTACCNADRGRYYYTTYDCREVTRVDLVQGRPDGTQLAVFPLRRQPRTAPEPDAEKFSGPS